MKHKPRIGVIRGGTSAEYEISLGTGATVLNIIRSELAHKYDAKDIFIDKSGLWHVDGIATTSHDALHRVDAVFNALHGHYGEDGKIQHLFEVLHKPFTGSGSLASAIGMNKSLAKNVFSRNDIKTPRSQTIHRDKVGEDQKVIVDQIFRSFHLPFIVKPLRSGSSFGISIVKAHRDIGPALAKALEHDHEILIEEYIPGIEATCGVIENFRGESLYALPPIEIIPEKGKGLFDFDAKYHGHSRELVPASFAHKIKEEVMNLAKKVHHAMGLRHYSRSDFIIHPKRGIYVLEVNTLPGLTKESLIPKALDAVGAGLHEFVDHLLRLAMKLEN